MKRPILATSLALALIGGAATFSESPLIAGARTTVQPSASQRVATLSIVNVGCVTCAPIVTRALSSIPGVANVSVKSGGGSATARVVYDPRKITPAAMAVAVTNTGYPAVIIKN